MNIVLEILWLPFIIIFSYLEALVKLFIPAKRKNVTGEIVLITGAGHGIGRNTAYEFAKLRSKLVLWDINKPGEAGALTMQQGPKRHHCEVLENLSKLVAFSRGPQPPYAAAAVVLLKHTVEATAEGCRKLGATAHFYVVDCSLKEEIYSAAEKVKRDVGDVSILVNNAGVAATADLLSTQDKQIENIFQINILAHHWTTKAFLPAMMENNHGHIVTIASVGGHVTVPFLVSYCSSKFAAVGFHRGLTQELAALGKDGIHTTCLCPTFVNTGLVKHPSTRFLPLLEAEKVAEKLVDGILCNHKMIFLPPILKVVLLLEKILPERALLALNKMNDVKFDAVIGYRHGKRELS